MKIVREGRLKEAKWITDKNIEDMWLSSAFGILVTAKYGMDDTLWANFTDLKGKEISISSQNFNTDDKAWMEYIKNKNNLRPKQSTFELQYPNLCA